LPACDIHVINVVISAHLLQGHHSGVDDYVIQGRTMKISIIQGVELGGQEFVLFWRTRTSIGGLEHPIIIYIGHVSILSSQEKNCHPLMTMLSCCGYTTYMIVELYRQVANVAAWYAVVGRFHTSQLLR